MSTPKYMYSVQYPYIQHCILCSIYTHHISYIIGCYPNPFLTNTAVGGEVSVPCDSIHSGFNSGSVTKWKCVSHLNWEGDFSTCTFKETWKNPLILARYSVVVDLEEATNNRSAFENSVCSSCVCVCVVCVCVCVCVYVCVHVCVCVCECVCVCVCTYVCMCAY